MVEIWHIARPDLIPACEREEQDSIQCADDGNSDLSEEGSGSYYDSDTEGSYSDNESDEEIAVVESAAQQANGTATGAKDSSRKQFLASLPTKKDQDATARRRAVSELPRPSFQSDDKPAKSNTPPNDSGINSPPKSSGNDDAANRKTDKAAGVPQVHEKTECECAKNGGHYPNVVMNQVYGISLEKIYNLLFHSEFIKKFFVEDQKVIGNYQYHN
jgi:hypothetical protein